MAKDDKFFKLQGKTIVIIDWANVYGWVGKLGWEVNPRKLFHYLKSYREIKDIRFYFGVEKGNKKSENFQRRIKDIGYNLISKEVKWVPVSLDRAHFKKFTEALSKITDDLKKSNTEIANQISNAIKTPIFRRKCDFDCEITIDVMKNIDKVKGVILFSGDGDYAALVNELISQRKQIIVVALKNTMGREYNTISKGVFICNIKRLEGFLR